MGVVGLHAHGVLRVTAPRTANSRSAGLFIMTSAPAGSVTRIGSATESMIEVQAVALGAHVGLRDAQLAVVLLDLLAGAAQVADVAQDGDERRALAGVGATAAQQLEEEVRAFDGVDQQQLARGPPSWMRALGQGGREQHVVEGHRAPAPFALAFAGDQQGLGPGVGDEHAPLGVGEQDRVGHGVEQRALAAQPAVRLRRATRLRPSADERRGQDAGQPASTRPRVRLRRATPASRPAGDVLAAARARTAGLARTGAAPQRARPGRGGRRERSPAAAPSSGRDQRDGRGPRGRREKSEREAGTP